MARATALGKQYSVAEEFYKLALAHDNKCIDAMIGLADLAYHIRQEFKVVGARACTMHNARTQQAHWARVLDAYAAMHIVPSSEIPCPCCDYQSVL